MKHDWNGPRSTLPRLTSPTSVPSRRKSAEAVRGVELALALPRAAAGAERVAVGDGIGRARLRQRLPRLEPVAAARRGSRARRRGRARSSGRSITRGPAQRRVATSSASCTRQGYSRSRRRPRVPTASVTERASTAVATDRLVWLDLEMTGLDVTRHVIVEIAALVTDGQLEPLDDGIDVIVHQPPEALAEMDDFVRTMHTKSALLAEIEASTAVARRRRRRRPSTTSQRTCPTPATAPMCGNSIGVDRRFLDHQLPELDRYLHYRSIDVSSFKELCRRWYPEVYKKRPGKAETHRALADVRESIAELRYYREHMLRAPAPPAIAPSVSRAARGARRAASVTERSRAEWPMSPMRHALPANSPRPPPTSMP